MSIVVLRAHYQKEPAIKPFLDKYGLIPCEILDSTTPYYVRLRVELPQGAPDSIRTEILLPHDAVLLLLVDAPSKTLGFALGESTPQT